jgi:hypothetical protein
MAEEIEEIKKPSNVEKSLISNDVLSEFSVEEENLQGQEDDFLNMDVEVETDDEGGAEVTFGEQEEETGVEPDDFFGNLVDGLSESSLSEISRYVMTSVEEDKNSRKDWEDSYTNGLDLLGLRYENRTEPFDGATGVVHPILNEAVTQFQAGAYKEMLPSSGPVRAQIVGEPSAEIEKQAQRVEDYMNYQIMYEMEEYEPEFDQMLFFLGLAGSAFKKVYFDDLMKRPVSKFIPAEDVVVPYTASDLRSAERVSHVTKMNENELRKLQVSGFYKDMELKGGLSEDTSGIEEKYDEIEGKSTNSYEEEYTLYECHCYFDLEEYPDKKENGEDSGIKLPYIVTVCADTQDVLSVRRNYIQDDPKKDKIPHFVQYKFTPGLGFYGFGLIHLLGNLSRTATANLRQLIDAGTLSNMPAGFKARGLRIADDSEPLQPGEFRDVDVPGGDLRTSLMALPYKEPSGTLFQLMGFVVQSAQRFIGTTDIGVGDGNQETPVGTTIALLERGAKIISAVHKRLHASLKNELKLLARLFGQDPNPYPYPVGVDSQVKTTDFDARIDIIPVSDPNIFSMSQRVVLAQEQLKLASAAPDLHNLYESYRRVYEALGVKNVDQILKPRMVPAPKDPAQENQDASVAAAGQAKLQAYPTQNHDAHIAVHLAYMQSKVAKMQPAVLLTLEKHIFEHIGLKAQVLAAQQLQPQEQQNPDLVASKVAEVQSQLMVDYLQKNPPQPDQEPLVALKQQELALRAQEQQTDAFNEQQKLKQDQVKTQQQGSIARERIQSTEDIANMRAQIALERTRK